ncbi:hypothetical protein EDB89DRAFT_1913013 [Lactarius sanguifluus]|nr:hypothetical protein EDB89DRAFT_1913013 [Lactarius sanguifluus]
MPQQHNAIVLRHRHNAITLQRRRSAAATRRHHAMTPTRRHNNMAPCNTVPSRYDTEAAPRFHDTDSAPQQHGAGAATPTLAPTQHRSNMALRHRHRTEMPRRRGAAATRHLGASTPTQRPTLPTAPRRRDTTIPTRRCGTTMGVLDLTDDWQSYRPVVDRLVKGPVLTGPKTATQPTETGLTRSGPVFVLGREIVDRLRSRSYTISFELHELQPSPSSSHDYDTSNTGSNGARRRRRRNHDGPVSINHDYDRAMPVDHDSDHGSIPIDYDNEEMPVDLRRRGDGQQQGRPRG